MAHSHSIAELREFQRRTRQGPLTDDQAPDVPHDAAIACESVIAVHEDAILYLAPGRRARTAFVRRSERETVVVQDRPGFPAEL